MFKTIALIALGVYVLIPEPTPLLYAIGLGCLFGIIAALVTHK